jgi:membrane-associated phospholipid phosphatase
MKSVPAIRDPYSDESFRRLSKFAYFTSAICLLLASAAFAIDLPLARFALEGRLPGDLFRALNFAEVFAHGLGVVTICLVIFVLDPLNRRALFRIGFCAFGAGLLASALKLVTARQRPHAFLHQTEARIGGVWDTFLGFLPRVMQQVQDPGSHTVQSLPSAHTATAVGFAFALAWRYPRGKWLFATFAVMAALQRIAVGAHYLSDTLAGSAVGALFVGICFDRRLARLCNRLLKRGSQLRDNDKSRLESAA